MSYAKTCKNGELTTKGFSASLEGMTLKAKAGQVALKGLSLVGNALAGIAVSFAINGLIKGIDYLINREEKLKESLSDSIDAFESTTSEIESLDEQVKTLGENIAELQKLKDTGTISIADDEELKKLKEENDELERQIALLQDKQIREGKQVLKDAEKQEDDYVQSRYSLGNNVTPAEELWGATQAYIYAINSGNDALAKEHGERAVDMYEKIQPTLEAYRSLEEAGYTLSESEQKHFEELKKGESAYLMYTYLTNNTKEAFVALNEEMQRSVLLRHLVMEKGMTEEQAGFVLDNVKPEDYEGLWDAEFTPPALTDYSTAEEYGKAYAEAWLSGIEGRVEEQPQNPDEITVSSFKGAWESFSTAEGTKESADALLELAKAGKLTVDAFKETDGTDAISTNIGLSAEEATQKVNQLVEDVKQLNAMKTGISAITSAYDEKKDSKDNRVGADTLNSMYDTLGVEEWDKANKKAWKDYKKVASDGSKSIGELKEAQDELATAYVNSNNFLGNITPQTKAYYVQLLKEMGVTNALEVANKALNITQNDMAAAKQRIRNEGYKVKDITADEIIELANEKDVCDELRYNLLLLGLQKADLNNNNKLDFSDDISSIRKFCKEVGVTSIALDTLNQIKQAQSQGKYAGDTASIAAITEQAQKDYNKALKKVRLGLKIDNLKINDGNPDNNKDKDKSKSTEQIDWIERALNVLQNAIDYTKSKFENLYNFKAKKNNLDTQIKQTTKLLNAQSKAAEKYKQKANQVGNATYKSGKNKGQKILSDDLIAKIQNGQIDGSLSELIATYGEKKGAQINEYMNWWDKYKDAKKNVQSTTKAIKELRDEKDQLEVDRAEQNIANLDSEIELVNSAKNKNKLEKEKISYIEKSYRYQIKIAKREKDSLKVAELRLQKEKDILAVKDAILQNTLDENEAKRGLYDARMENATSTAEKNQILDDKIDSYASDQSTLDSNYKDKKATLKSKDHKQDTLKAIKVGDYKSAVKDSKVADKNKKKILELIKARKKIPEKLLNLKNVQNNPKLLESLLDYNAKIDGVDDTIQNELDSLDTSYQTSTEQNETSTREAEQQKYRNIADDAQADFDLAQSRSANATSAKEKNKYEAESRIHLKEQYEALMAEAELIADVEDRERERAKLQEEYSGAIADSYKREYDNIKAEYDAIIGLNDTKQATIESEISALEAQGKSVSKTFYQNLINSTKQEKQMLQNELNALNASGQNLEYGSDAWYAWKNDIETVTQALNACDESIANTQQSINDLNRAMYKRKGDFLDFNMDYLQYLEDMLAYDDLTSKDVGGLTKEGFATLSLYGEKMKVIDEGIKNINDDWAELNRQINAGEYKGTYEEGMQESFQLAQDLWEKEKERKELEEQSLSLVKEAFDIQLDALNEMIAKRKEELRLQEELWNYQKEIEDKTTNINSIEKQIAALTGDASEEARLKLQQLNVELSDAREDLEETEYDKWLSDQETMLDNMTVEFEEFFTNMLDEPTAILTQIKEIMANSSDTLQKIFDEKGYGDPDDVSETKNPDGSTTYTIPNGSGTTHSLDIDKDNNITGADGGSIKLTEQQRRLSAVMDLFNMGKDKTVTTPQNEVQRYVWEQTGSVVDNNILQGMAKVLGVSDDWLSQAHLSGNPLIQALKNVGFSSGGIGKIIKASGEDGIALVRNGEGFVMPEHVTAIQDLMDSLPMANHLMDNIVKIPNLTWSRNMSKGDIHVGDVSVHLDGSNVTDMDSMFKQLQEPRNKKKLMDCVTSQMMNPQGNLLQRF